MRFLDRDGVPVPAVITCVGILLAAMFVFFPGIDMAVAGMLWDGDRFPMRTHWIGDFFDQNLMQILLLFFALWCLSWGVSEMTGRFCLGLTRKKYAFSVFSILLSAGLVTNVIFKNHWGRARPVHLEVFGGAKVFSPAFFMANQCERNCSFFSGDTSFAFSMLAIVLVLPPSWKKRLVPGVMGFGALVGVMRMLHGAHFLSDVIFAAIFTILVIQAMKFLILDRRGEA